MDITTLSIFVEVMRRGSFAAVAKDRNVDPSSISRLIASLEEELGIRLFQRSTRQLTATEGGRVYFEKVEPLVEELEHARLAARDVSVGPSGTLRISTTVAFGQICLVPLLPDFRNSYPGLALELVLTDSNLDLIGERIDVAIRLGPRLDLGYVGAKLFSTRYRVCASPAYVARQGRPSRRRSWPGTNAWCSTCLAFATAGCSGAPTAR
jgi:DNA-binding transcriptional LysR family regulator